MGEHLQHECPRCQSDADRVWAGLGGHSFAAAGGGATANSGVHEQDYPTADKAVGRSADELWELNHERAKVKKAARESVGKPALIRTDGEGYSDYSHLPDPQLQVRRTVADKAFAALAQQKANKS